MARDGEVIERAAHGAAAQAQHVRVNHGGADVGMAQQFLHGADVVARLQQVGGERMAQRVRRGRLVDAGGGDGELEGALEVAFEQVMSAAQVGARVDRQRRLRKHPLPGPRVLRARVLARQGIGQVDARQPRFTVGLPDAAHVVQLLAQRPLERRWQHDDPILATLALAHHDGTAVEVDVLHTQAQALEQAHAGAVKQPADDAVRVAGQLLLLIELVEHGLHFRRGQHGRQPPLRPRTADLDHPRKVLAQHLLVQEQQRGQRLTVRAGCDLAVGRKPGQEGLDLRLRQFRRVAQAVEADEGTNPVDVGVLGAQAVVQQPHLLAQLVEQAGAWGWRRHQDLPARVLYIHTVSEAQWLANEVPVKTLTSPSRAGVGVRRHGVGSRPDTADRWATPLSADATRTAGLAPTAREAALHVTKRLAPGQRGAVALTRRFGESLICVRHREDAVGAYRYVTVELLVDRTAIAARNRRRVGIRLDFRESDLRATLKRHGAAWDPQHRVWAIDRKTAAQLGLQDRIVMAY